MTSAATADGIRKVEAKPSSRQARWPFWLTNPPHHLPLPVVVMARFLYHVASFVTRKDRFPGDIVPDSDSTDTCLAGVQAIVKRNMVSEQDPSATPWKENGP
jgi:hypothetical protein